METIETLDNGTQGTHQALGDNIDRLSAVAAQFEKRIAWLEERQPVASAGTLSGQVPRVVAAIEPAPTFRETELERRLEEAENQIVELRAQASRPVPARKTLPAVANHLLAKHGQQGIESIEAGALDAALTGLSLEQRIAVKSQLLRAGALI